MANIPHIPSGVRKHQGVRLPEYSVSELQEYFESKGVGLEAGDVAKIVARHLASRHNHFVALSYARDEIFRTFGKVYRQSLWTGVLNVKPKIVKTSAQEIIDANTPKEMQIKYHGWHTVTLTGNLLTGDTFKLREWIKHYLNGKWDAEHKGWIVDLTKVDHYSGGGDTLMVK